MHLVTSYRAGLQPIKCKAAIAWEAKKPLEVKTVTVDPPGPGEVRVKVRDHAIDTYQERLAQDHPA